MSKLLSIFLVMLAFELFVVNACDFPVISTGVPLNDKNIIQNKHHALRKSIADGQVADQPKAKNLFPLAYDISLARSAQSHANNCVYAHNSPTDPRRFYIGQNIYIEWFAQQFKDANWDNAIQSWFDEHVNFIYPNKSNGVTGHYTQVVWAKTKYMGCGVTQYLNGTTYYQLYVCNYAPGGNYNNEAPYEI